MGSCSFLLSSSSSSAAATYTLDVVRAVVSSGFDGNVVVLLKVDPSVAAREQLAADKQGKI